MRISLQKRCTRSVENAATVADYVGGDTASFRPLKLDEEEVDEDVFEEQQDTNH